MAESDALQNRDP